MFNESFFSFLGNVQGATSATILMLIVLASLIIMRTTHIPIIVWFHKFVNFIRKMFGRFINKQEEIYHRDKAIGKINEKRTKDKMYRFLSELIIDLDLEKSGMTPYELLYITIIITFIVVTIICQMLFGSAFMTIVMTPLAVIGVFCTMYTKANIAHDTRIESVIEAENIICNNIKVGVVVAVRESLDAMPKSVRPQFKDFIDNVEQKNYHIKTALIELNMRLGSVADDFIKKCIVFEMEEEHGIAGMFADIVEINNINMEMRTEMKRRFEEVKTEFLIGAGMIFTFLCGVLVIYPTVRNFYFKTFIGNSIIVIDALIIMAEFVFITYLRAKEL